MADNSNPFPRTSTAAMTTKYPVFIDTNLGTHFLMSLSFLDPVSDFKREIEKEHVSLFSDIGEIVVQALKVKRRGIFYVLSDSMVVSRAFASSKANWFLSVDVSRREIEAPTEKHAELENGLVDKHDDLDLVMVEKQASQPVKILTRKPEEDLRAVDTVSSKKQKMSKPKNDIAVDDVENGKNSSESPGLDIETSASKETEALKENPEHRKMEDEVSAQNGAVVVTQLDGEDQGVLSENLGSPGGEETGPKPTDGAADLGAGNEKVVVAIETGKKRKLTKKAKDLNVPAEPLKAQSENVRHKNSDLSLKEGNEVVKENCKSLDVVGDTAVNKEVKSGESTGKPSAVVEEPEKKKPKASSKRINLPESQKDLDEVAKASSSENVEEPEKKKPTNLSKRINLPESQKDLDEVPKESSAKDVEEPEKKKPKTSSKRTNLAESQKDLDEVPKESSAENVEEPEKTKPKTSLKRTNLAEWQKDLDEVPKESSAENVEEPEKKKPKTSSKRTNLAESQKDLDEVPKESSAKNVEEPEKKKPKTSSKRTNLAESQKDLDEVPKESSAKNVEEPEKKKPKTSSKRTNLAELQKDLDEVPKESSAENVEEPAKKKRTRTVTAKSKPVASSRAKKLKSPSDQTDSFPVEPKIETRNLTEVSGAGNKEKNIVPKSTSPSETKKPNEVSGTGNKKALPKKPVVEKKGVPKRTSPTEIEKPKEVSGTDNEKKTPVKLLVEKKGQAVRAPKTRKTSKINDNIPDTHSVQTSSSAQPPLKSNRKRGTQAVVIPEPALEEKSDESMGPSEKNINSSKDPKVPVTRNGTTKDRFKTPLTKDTQLKKSSGAEKKLIPSAGAIFGDDLSSSGDSDDSTRTPSTELTSSDDSDSNSNSSSLQSAGWQTQDKSKNANKTSVIKSASESGRRNSIPFELLIQKTSEYKKAKLIASQSQPED